MYTDQLTTKQVRRNELVEAALEKHGGLVKKVCLRFGAENVDDIWQQASLAVLNQDDLHEQDVDEVAKRLARSAFRSGSNLWRSNRRSRQVVDVVGRYKQHGEYSEAESRCLVIGIVQEVLQRISSDQAALFSAYLKTKSVHRSARIAGCRKAEAGAVISSVSAEIGEVLVHHVHGVCDDQQQSIKDWVHDVYAPRGATKRLYHRDISALSTHIKACDPCRLSAEKVRKEADGYLIALFPITIWFGESAALSSTGWFDSLTHVAARPVEASKHALLNLLGRGEVIHASVASGSTPKTGAILASCIALCGALITTQVVDRGDTSHKAIEVEMPSASNGVAKPPTRPMKPWSTTHQGSEVKKATTPSPSKSETKQQDKSPSPASQGDRAEQGNSSTGVRGDVVGSDTEAKSASKPLESESDGREEFEPGY